MMCSFDLKVAATDYHTTTDSSTNIILGMFFPRGEFFAGNEDVLHVYSINTTLRPGRRLYLSTTFSYSQSRLLTGVNNGTTVVPKRATSAACC